MKRSALFLLLVGCSHVAPRPEMVVTNKVPPFIKNVQQLTYEGRRSGEGYFSTDGREMIFQSEREPGNPFYQIYLRNLETGETHRLSNGKGKTTCAWLHPSLPKAMFSSTHLDPQWKKKADEQIEIRRRGEKEKYAWSYDDQFDIFEADLRRSGKYKALNPARGYDAEGSYSPDGQWIAFASNRHAYSEKLSEADLKRREEDPSFFLDIYLMRADGRDLKRLTTSLGYDGGPFFSPDGQSIVWRRFTADGRQADVWTMKLDGGEQKQITNFKSMSWAPFFHPSGDYLIFTSNKLGYDNFELFIVDREGHHEPVRVSERAGFDGLPVFTPDGHRLAWTQKNEKGESQIYFGEWSDQLARTALGLPDKKLAPALGSPEIRQSEARSWVEYLASETMKGRRSGSPEENEYHEALISNFKRLGLEPYLKTGFRQEFSFQAGVRYRAVGQNALATSKGKSWTVDKDWAPLSFSANGKFEPSEVVFAGYGIVAPANEKSASFDSYQNLNVKGRWALVLKDLPNEIANAERYQLNLYAKLQHKALVARQAGALGLIVINSTPGPVALKYEGAGSGITSIPVLTITPEVAEEWLRPTGKSLALWQKELDTGASAGAVIQDLKISSSILLEPVEAKAANVIAVLKVPGAQSTVMIGAHGDHLGLGESGNSLAKGHEVGLVHAGADDNASGVAAVMELAHALTHQVKTGSLRPKTNLAFAIWSAEEVGVLGSTFFVNHNKSPLKAYLNLDMVGRLREQLVVQGTGSSKKWNSWLEPVLSTSGISVSTQSDPYLPTDAMAFYLKKVPSLSFFTGAHAEYHTPKDQAHLINYEGLVKVAQIVADVSQVVSQSVEPLPYEKVEGRNPTQGGRGFRLYLGTIPDYSQEGVKGVRISGTTKASPAESAGLREGDVIVELGGTKIDNIQDYVYCLQSMKANQKTPLRVLRDGVAVKLEIVPALKGM